MTEKDKTKVVKNIKRFDYTHYDDGTESIYDRKKDEYYWDIDLSRIEELLNELNDENEELKQKNKTLKNQYERKDRALKRTKKDIDKYTDYFMREMNWDCDRIIKEVFRW